MRAEHLQGSRIITRVLAVVQQAGIGKTKRCPADRCNYRTVVEKFMDRCNDPAPEMVLARYLHRAG